MKLSINKLIDTSKFMVGEAGQELADFIIYVAGFSEQVLRALRNGLTFGDNFNAKVSSIEFEDGVAQVVNTDKKKPTGIIPLRVVSTSSAISTFGWYINGDGETVATVGFTGSPSVKLKVTLAILF